MARNTYSSTEYMRRVFKKIHIGCGMSLAPSIQLVVAFAALSILATLAAIPVLLIIAAVVITYRWLVTQVLPVVMTEAGLAQAQVAWVQLSVALVGQLRLRAEWANESVRQSELLG